MNINNFGNTIEENELAENDVFNMFMSSFKRKVKFHPSLFENSFTQKISPQPTPNFEDHKSSKYMEFRLVSNEFLSDLHSLTGHIECKIMEKKPAFFFYITNNKGGGEFYFINFSCIYHGMSVLTLGILATVCLA